MLQALIALGIVLKIATLAPEGSLWMTLFHNWGKSVEEHTSGKIKVKFYAGGIAGDGMQLGAIAGREHERLVDSGGAQGGEQLGLPGLVDEQSLAQRRRTGPMADTDDEVSGARLDRPGHGRCPLYEAKSSLWP